MIIIGAPVSFLRKGRPCRSTHMISTIAGRLGRAELIAFAVKIGLRAYWLQKVNSEYEHFDVMGGRIDRAKVAGARQVDRRRFMEFVASKREALTGSKRRRAYAYAQAVQARQASRAPA